MTAYACGSGGVIFVAEEIERAVSASPSKMKKVAMAMSNDNKSVKRATKKKKSKTRK